MATGGGITGFPPHDTAREDKGERMGMDGRSHGGGRAKDLSDGISKGRGEELPSRRVPGAGGDKDVDAHALLEKARAGHGRHTGGGKPPPPPVRELQHVGAVAVP